MSENEQCLLYDKLCTNCGECDMCDLDPNKHCDSCGDCLSSSGEFRTLDVLKYLTTGDKKVEKKDNNGFKF